MQVSSDLSIVDLDVPFSFMFSISASLNAYSNLGVLAVVTWQVLFIAVPMIVLAIRLQVNSCDLFGNNFVVTSFIYHLSISAICCYFCPRSEQSTFFFLNNKWSTIHNCN